MGEPRSELVLREHQGELLRDRHRPCGSVRLRRLSLAVAVDLVAEPELGVFKIVKTGIRPGQRERLREAGPGQTRNGEQRPVRLPRGPDGLLKFAPLEDPPALSLRWLRPVGGKHQRHRIRARPAKPASSIPVDAIRNAEDDSSAAAMRS